MERETRDSDLVELGSASADTHGSPIPTVEEDFLYVPLGLSDE